MATAVGRPWLERERRPRQAILRRVKGGSHMKRRYATASAAICAGLSLFLAAGTARGAGVRAGFDLSAPERGPFPSDRFTVADPDQLTGRRIAMPLPDCKAAPSDCDDLAVINELDGFN